MHTLVISSQFFVRQLAYAFEQVFNLAIYDTVNSLLIFCRDLRPFKIKIKFNKAIKLNRIHDN